MNDEDRYDAERVFYDADEYQTGEYVESDDHVPTTSAIRAVYATDYYMVEVGSKGTVLGRAAAFNRWLRERDRAVAEKAWQEGWDQGFRDYRAAPTEEGYTTVTPTANPYT